MFYKSRHHIGLLVAFCLMLIISMVPPCASQSQDTKVTFSSTEVADELFPAIAKHLAEGNRQFNLTPIVRWRLDNKEDEPVKVTLMSGITQWTPECINTVILNAGESKEIAQNPFGPNLLRVKSLIPATLITKVIVNDKIVGRSSTNINIRAAGDMIWSMQAPFDSAYMIAAWITPNDPFVEQILGLARKKWHLRSRSLSGYAGSDVTAQIRAIFDAVRSVGIGYVDSHVTFGQVGHIQRVRLPGESVQQRAANCIDGAVLFASLFENIGLEPLIILTPTHAFVGVKTAPNSKQAIFIETTVVGRSKLESLKKGEFTYDAAIKEGANQYNKALNAAQSDKYALYIIDIKKARAAGIHPLW